MKKIVLMISIVCGTVAANSQSLDDVREELGKKDINYTKAKDLIDKYLVNPKNSVKADGWYYKGYIYNAISKRDDLKTLCTDCKMEAFEAFKKYQSIDTKNILLGIEQNASFFDVTNGFIENGGKAYGEKNYKDAFTNFKNALIVEDYVKSKIFDYKGYEYPKLDTVLIENAALSARFDKNDEEAIKYYKLLTDANLSEPRNLEMYEYLAQYYAAKKDAANFENALAQGRKLYPTESYWTALEIDFATEGQGQEAIFNKYEELLQKSPDNYDIAFRYSQELYKYLADQTTAIDKAKRDAYRTKLTTALNKAIALKSTAEANLLMGIYLYNSAYDYSDESKLIKGVKPEDTKKRRALIDLSTSTMNAAIPYLEKTNTYYAALSNQLKPVDKANYKNSLGMLQNIYIVKKDASKAADYGKQLSALN